MVRIFRSTLSVFLMGVMMIGVFSCSKDDDSSENDTYTRSVLVYISAQNSLKGNVDNDVIEMLAGASRMGDRDRLVLFLDDNNRS